MEPLTLKCASCETEWKLFKVGSDPIVCPKCQAPITLPEGTSLPTPPTDAPPPTTSTVAVESSITPPPIPEPPSPPSRPFREPLQHDDEERDYGEPDDYIPVQRRSSSMHPLVVVIIILLLIFVLLPLAVIVLFWAMCALSV